jgi:hypothetical protein
VAKSLIRASRLELETSYVKIRFVITDIDKHKTRSFIIAIDQDIWNIIDEDFILVVFLKGAACHVDGVGVLNTGICSCA